MIQFENPIIIKILLPKNSNGFININFNGEFLNFKDLSFNEFEYFQIIGWNNDHLSKFFHKNQIIQKGGFIIQSINYNNNFGNDLLYLIDENFNLNDIDQCNNIFQINSLIECFDSNYCELNTTYQILNIFNNFISLLNINNNNILNFNKLNYEYLHYCFKDLNFFNNLCNYLFLPYSLIENLEKLSPNFIQPSAISLKINWKIKK